MLTYPGTTNDPKFDNKKIQNRKKCSKGKQSKVPKEKQESKNCVEITGKIIGKQKRPYAPTTALCALVARARPLSRRRVVCGQQRAKPYERDKQGLTK